MALQFLYDGYFAGTVGIGTIAPTAQLEIITTRTGTPSNDTNIKVTDNTAQAADVGGSINFTGKYTDAGVVLSGSPFIRASKKNSTTGDYGYGLKFGVRGTGSGTSNVAMTIDSDSNVGIGTDSPGAKLDIAAVTNAVVRLTSTGNGLGADTALGSLQFYGNDASAPGAGIKSSIVAKTEAALGDDSNLIFSTSSGTTNNVERMRITPSGNVGIGTTSPDNITSTGTVLSISTQGALTTNSLAGSLTFLTNDTSFTNEYADGVTT